MEISFAPELEARLSRIAARSGKGPHEIVHDLVANYIDHDEWVRQQIAKASPIWTRANSSPTKK